MRREYMFKIRYPKNPHVYYSPKEPIPTKQDKFYRNTIQYCKVLYSTTLYSIMMYRLNRSKSLHTSDSILVATMTKQEHSERAFSTKKLTNAMTRRCLKCYKTTSPDTQVSRTKKEKPSD